jgi:hypothetical protein
MRTLEQAIEEGEELARNKRKAAEYDLQITVYLREGDGSAFY